MQAQACLVAHHQAIKLFRGKAHGTLQQRQEAAYKKAQTHEHPGTPPAAVEASRIAVPDDENVQVRSPALQCAGAQPFCSVFLKCVVKFVFLKEVAILVYLTVPLYCVLSITSVALSAGTSRCCHRCRCWMLRALKKLSALKPSRKKQKVPSSAHPQCHVLMLQLRRSPFHQLMTTL